MPIVVIGSLGPWRSMGMVGSCVEDGGALRGMVGMAGDGGALRGMVGMAGDGGTLRGMVGYGGVL